MTTRSRCTFFVGSRTDERLGTALRRSANQLRNNERLAGG